MEMVQARLAREHPGDPGKWHHIPHHRNGGVHLGDTLPIGRFLNPECCEEHTGWLRERGISVKGEEESKQVSIISISDSAGTDIIDSADLQIVAQHTVRAITLSGDDPLVADVNDQGNVNVDDLQLVA